MTRPSHRQPFTTKDARTAFDHVRPLAEALPEEEVPVYTGDATIAKHNVTIGIDALRPTIEARLASTKDPDEAAKLTSLLELPVLALALVHAEGRIPTKGTSTGEIARLTSEVSEPRELLIMYLVLAGRLNLVPLDRAEAIRVGRGRMDNARDCVDAPALFTEFAANVKNKHPFAPGYIDDLAKKGNALVELLTPSGVSPKKGERAPEALLVDSIAKLLDDSHDKLRVMGCDVWGMRKVDDHVPPLHSRSNVTKTAKSTT